MSRFQTHDAGGNIGRLIIRTESQRGLVAWQGCEGDGATRLGGTGGAREHRSRAGQIDQVSLPVFPIRLPLIGEERRTQDRSGSRGAVVGFGFNQLLTEAERISCAFVVLIGTKLVVCGSVLLNLRATQAVIQSGGYNRRQNVVGDVVGKVCRIGMVRAGASVLRGHLLDQDRSRGGTGALIVSDVGFIRSANRLAVRRGADQRKCMYNVVAHGVGDSYVALVRSRSPSRTDCGVVNPLLCRYGSSRGCGGQGALRDHSGRHQIGEWPRGRARNRKLSRRIAAG